MKWVKSAVIILLSIVPFLYSSAQVKSEEMLVNRILQSMQRSNDTLYNSLFFHYDTLANAAQVYTPFTHADSMRINNIRSRPQKLQQYDPVLNDEIDKDFHAAIQKGRDSGLHWKDILLVRYDLEKMLLAKEMIGLEKIIPDRLQGYIFIQDMLTRRTYAIAIKDIFGLNGKWYGGRIVNILEADDADQYIEKLALERKVEKQKLIAQLYGSDEQQNTTATEEQAKPKPKTESTNPNEDEEHKTKITTEVVERKLYTGKFDNELQVTLYVRSLKGACPQLACAWEAIYKFGDLDEYIKLDVSKTPDGKWSFTEEDVGVMEVTMSGGKLTGTWTSFKDKTEYDVVLTEKKDVKPRILFQLDGIFEGTGDDSGDEY